MNKFRMMMMGMMCLSMTAPESSLLCSVGDDPPPGGAGGGGVDDEAKWNERFHKASTEREKRFKASLVKELGAMFESQFSGKFDEIRKLLVESDPKPPGGDPDDKDKGAGGHKLSSEAEAMIRQAQRDAKEAKQLADKWQSEATAEKGRASKNEERQALMAQLNGKVKPALLDMVVDQLHVKHLTRDPETGTILWKDDDGNTLPLKEAVTAWAKSDVGKEFTPPKEVRGTGSRGGTPEENASRIPGTMNAETLGGIVLGSIPGNR